MYGTISSAKHHSMEMLMHISAANRHIATILEASLALISTLS